MNPETETLLSRLETMLAPVGGLPVVILSVTGAALLMLFVIVILLWRRLAWARRSHIQLVASAEYLRRLQARKEKPEDAVARVLRDRIREQGTDGAGGSEDPGDSAAPAAPAAPAASKRKKRSPVSPIAEEPAPDAPLPMPAGEDRSLPQWRAVGYDLQTGMDTTILVRARNLPQAHRLAEERGIDVTSIENTKVDDDAESGSN